MVAEGRGGSRRSGWQQKIGVVAAEPERPTVVRHPRREETQGLLKHGVKQPKTDTEPRSGSREKETEGKRRGPVPPKGSGGGAQDGHGSEGGSSLHYD